MTSFRSSCEVIQALFFIMRGRSDVRCSPDPKLRHLRLRNAPATQYAPHTCLPARVEARGAADPATIISERRPDEPAHAGRHDAYPRRIFDDRGLCYVPVRLPVSGRVYLGERGVVGLGQHRRTCLCFFGCNFVQPPVQPPVHSLSLYP